MCAQCNGSETGFKPVSTQCDTTGAHQGSKWSVVYFSPQRALYATVRLPSALETLIRQGLRSQDVDLEYGRAGSVPGKSPSQRTTLSDHRCFCQQWSPPPPPQRSLPSLLGLPLPLSLPLCTVSSPDPAALHHHSTMSLSVLSVPVFSHSQFCQTHFHISAVAVIFHDTHQTSLWCS